MKRLILLLCFLSLIFLLGCANDNTSIENAKIAKIEPSRIKVSESKYPNEKYPYFVQNIEERVKYKATFAFDDFVDCDVNVVTKKIKEFKNGSFYEIRIDAVQGVPEERLVLGYFYVDENRIYKIIPSEENLKSIVATGIIPSDSVVVCQKDELNDKLSKNSKGWHHVINIKGNTITYSEYNNTTDTGYFETIVWEKYRGMTMYRSGFGAERDLVELRLTGNKQ